METQLGFKRTERVFRTEDLDSLDFGLVKFRENSKLDSGWSGQIQSGFRTYIEYHSLTQTDSSGIFQVKP